MDTKHHSESVEVIVETHGYTLDNQTNISLVKIVKYLEVLACCASTNSLLDDWKQSLNQSNDYSLYLRIDYGWSSTYIRFYRVRDFAACEK